MYENKVTRLNHAVDCLMKSGAVSTQKDIAEKMNVQRSTVNASLNGKYGNPTDSFLKKFAWAFGFNQDYLINGTGTLEQACTMENVSMDNNTGVITNGNNNVVDGVPSNEHDALIRSNAIMESMKTIVETVDDPALAIEIIGKILGANAKSE